MRVLAQAELAHAALDDGDVEGAEKWLGRAIGLVEGWPGAGWWGWLNRVGARIASARGDLVDARRWAEGIADGFWRPVVEARAHLAEGEREAALATLEVAVPRCPRHEVVLSLLRAHASAPGDPASKALAVAVEVAVANGMLQTVASEGHELLDRVELAAWRAPAEWVERLRRTSVGAPRPVAAEARHEPFALTDRERDVLRFLPSRLTQREIADELYVSVNTLKFHLKVIYRKLGVSSRGEAADVARRLASGARPPT
jgi:LuxR family maltose regulon positive regulatory protein